MVCREKVIKGLHCCSHTDGVNCIYCPYDNSDTDCTALMAMDVLALLKEQSTTEFFMDEYRPTCKVCGFRPFAGYIPTLERMKERGFNFCPRCGRLVKWE